MEGISGLYSTGSLRNRALLGSSALGPVLPCHPLVPFSHLDRLFGEMDVSSVSQRDGDGDEKEKEKEGIRI